MTSETRAMVTKISLEQLNLEYVTFSESFSLSGQQLLERTSLFGKPPFLSPYNTFHNFKIFVHVSILFLSNCEPSEEQAISLL